MEKKYLIVNIEDIENGVINNSGDTEVVYFVDSPFKQYLFDEVVKEEKTDVLDREEFDWNIEIYKLLKKSIYFGYDKIKVSILSGWSGEFTLEESKLICEAYENKVVDLDELLKEVRDKDKPMSKDYKLFEKAFFKQLDVDSSIHNFVEMFGKYKNVCLLCSEPTSEKCHRRLVSEKLLELFRNDIVFGGNL